MKKRIEIQVDKINWVDNTVVFYISKQSHRGDGITGTNLCDPFVLNNIRICSSLYPEFSPIAYSQYRAILFLRGFETGKDDARVTVSFKDFSDILQAITEYNAFEFSDKKHKIVIDGKEIEISAESFKALKDSLKA